MVKVATFKCYNAAIIDARSAAYIIKGGLPPLYLITRQRVFPCGLMISNSFGIDDIHAFGVIGTRRCAISLKYGFFQWLMGELTKR